MPGVLAEILMNSLTHRIEHDLLGNREVSAEAYEFKDVLKMGCTQLQDAVPMIPEVVNQIAFEVIGNDLTITMAAEAGQLQLNAFEPITAHSLFKSVTHLRQGCLTLADCCVSGITANRERLRASVENSIGIVTALNPYIGYANATEIAAEALATGGVYDIVLAKGLLSKAQLDDILRPEVLTQPRLIPPSVFESRL